MSKGSQSTTDCPFTAALRDDAPKWGHENSSHRSQAGLVRNRAELTVADLCLCAMEDDARHQVTCIAADLGHTEAAAREYRKIGLMLSRMPFLAHVFTVRGFMPLRLLKKLASVTFPVEEELFKELEPLLLAAVLPNVDKLAMPEWKGLFAGVQAAIDAVQHSARPVDLAGAPVPEEVEESFTVRAPVAPERATHVSLKLDPAHAEETNRVISTIAATKECDNAQAFMHLVRGTADVSVGLHLYRSLDGGPVYMPGVGALSEVVAAEYLAMVDSVDIVAPSATGGYAATANQRAFVIGRDGSCMFPGCTRRVADMDHITNYDEGGPTDTHNLHGLCRRHHNEKTKGLWDVTRSLEGTEYWTSHCSGAQVASEPDGPIRHPGVVPFGASVRKAGKLRAEHNEKRDTARAEVRVSVVQARRVQPVVRMLQHLRVMSPEETAEDLINSVTEEAAAVAAAAASHRVSERTEHEELRVRRYRAQARSGGPVTGADPPTVSAPDAILEILQVYLNERDADGALKAIGRLLAKIDPDTIKGWENSRSFDDPSPLKRRIRHHQAEVFRRKVRPRRRRTAHADRAGPSATYRG